MVSPDSYSIIKNIDELEYVIIWNDALPQTIPEYSMIGKNQDDDYVTYKSFSDKVYFLEETTGDITVYISAINNVTGAIYEAELTSKSGNLVGENQLIASIEKEMELSEGEFSNQYKIVSILEFGREVNLR